MLCRTMELSPTRAGKPRRKLGEQTQRLLVPPKDEELDVPALLLPPLLPPHDEPPLLRYPPPKPLPQLLLADGAERREPAA